MREILFKAKRKDDGEWVEGYVFELQPEQYAICDKKQYDSPSTFPVWEFFRYCSHEIEPVCGEIKRLHDGNRSHEISLVCALQRN